MFWNEHSFAHLRFPRLRKEFSRLVSKRGQVGVGKKKGIILAYPLCLAAHLLLPWVPLCSQLSAHLANPSWWKLFNTCLAQVCLHCMHMLTWTLIQWAISDLPLASVSKWGHVHSLSHFFACKGDAFFKNVRLPTGGKAVACVATFAQVTQEAYTLLQKIQPIELLSIFSEIFLTVASPVRGWLHMRFSLHPCVAAA